MPTSPLISSEEVRKGPWGFPRDRCTGRRSAKAFRHQGEGEGYRRPWQHRDRVCFTGRAGQTPLHFQKFLPL